MKKPLIVAKQEEVAEWYGVTTRTVRNWLSAGMPRKGERYDLRAIAIWHSKRNAAGDVTTNGDDSLRVQKLKAEIAKLRAEVKSRELKNSLAQEDLITRDEAEQFFSELCILVRTRLEDLPDDFEMSFPAETRQQNKQDLEDKVRLLLKEMSETQLPSELDGNRNDDGESDSGNEVAADNG